MCEIHIVKIIFHQDRSECALISLVSAISLKGENRLNVPFGASLYFYGIEEAAFYTLSIIVAET